MVANRGTLTWLSWALVIFVLISAAVTLLFVLGVLLPPPDETDDFVDQLLFMRTHDQQAFPYVIVGSLATLGVYLIAAMLGVLLRAWSEPTPTRDAMTLLLVFGGVIGRAGFEDCSMRNGSPCRIRRRFDEIERGRREGQIPG